MDYDLGQKWSIIWQLALYVSITTHELKNNVVDRRKNGSNDNLIRSQLVNYKI